MADSNELIKSPIMSDLLRNWIGPQVVQSAAPMYIQQAEEALASIDAVLKENRPALELGLPGFVTQLETSRDRCKENIRRARIRFRNAKPDDWYGIASSVVRELTKTVAELASLYAEIRGNVGVVNEALAAPRGRRLSNQAALSLILSPESPSEDDTTFIESPRDEASTSGIIAHAGTLASIGENFARAGLDVVMSQLTHDFSGDASDSAPEAVEPTTSSNTPNIMSLLKTAIQSKTVLNLGGDLAQLAVDVMQERLHTSSLGDLVSGQVDHQSVRKDVLYTMRKLSMTSERLPSSLFLDGVQRLPGCGPISGGFADVYRGTYSGQTVALKCLRVTASDVATNMRRGKMAFFQESLTWANLRHDHVLPFLGVDKQHTMCMVLPWMEHGNINECIRSLRKADSFSDGLTRVNQWIYEIALGLAFLHAEKIVHGDLRGANILIDQDFKIRLADFGLAVFAEASSKRTSSGSMKPWLAPELAWPEHYGLDTSRPTQPGDIYALGCVCFELYTGQLPLSELSPFNRVFEVVMRGRKPLRPSFYDGEMMSDDLWLVVDQTFEKVPGDRPTAAYIVTGTKAIALVHSDST